MREILKNKTILVVDDNHDNREVVVQTMQKMAVDVKVYSANNGQQALQVLEKKEVHLVLLDWEMPVMNGLETLQKIKEDERLQNIPVLMYTGVMTASTDLQKALENGASDFLRKPADAIELLARVQSILQQKEHENNRILLERENATIKQEALKAKYDVLEKELSNNLLALANKNELLKSIKDQCEESLIEDQNPKIKKISSHIETILRDDDYWTIFLSQMGHIDQNFLQRIQEKYPILTNGELRFCALLRAGMESKSIANLLNISMDSAMKARYRIRKKMELETDENLEKTIFEL